MLTNLVRSLSASFSSFLLFFFYIFPLPFSTCIFLFFFFHFLSSVFYSSALLFFPLLIIPRFFFLYYSSTPSPLLFSLISSSSSTFLLFSPPEVSHASPLRQENKNNKHVCPAASFLRQGHQRYPLLLLEIQRRGSRRRGSRRGTGGLVKGHLIRRTSERQTPLPRRRHRLHKEIITGCVLYGDTRRSSARNGWHD